MVCRNVPASSRDNLKWCFPSGISPSGRSLPSDMKGKIHVMMTSSNGNIFSVTGHLCGEFTGHQWILHTMASDAEHGVFFDLRLNKRLSKQWWGWWFETPSHPLWRHYNVIWYPLLDNTNRLINLFINHKQLLEDLTCVGRVICPKGRVLSSNKCNPIQTGLWFITTCTIGSNIRYIFCKKSRHWYSLSHMFYIYLFVL